jgi:membrane protease YdiL (CAAX protease family)
VSEADLTPDQPVAPSASGAAVPPREGPFGPVAANARLTYVWASPLAQIGMYLVSIVPAVIVAVIVMVPVVLSGSIAIDADASMLPAELELPLLVTLVVVQFPAWALLVIAWVRGFERRSLASAGFQGPRALRKYGIGLAVGVGIAVALALLSPLVEPGELSEVSGFSLSHVLTGPWLLMMLGVVAVFLVQGSCEEIAFRGWMLSAVAARRGVMAGVLMNTIVFGVLHVHVFMSGVVVGFAAIVAISCVGLFLSLWAVSERSIAGVCGAHGAFNATLVLIGMAGLAGTNPDATPGEVLLQVIREATAQDGSASLPGALLQLAVFAGLSALVWRLWLRGR